MPIGTMIPIPRRPTNTATSTFRCTNSTSANTYAAEMNPARFSTLRVDGGAGSPDFRLAGLFAPAASPRSSFGLREGGGPVGRGLRRLAIADSLYLVSSERRATSLKQLRRREP